MSFLLISLRRYSIVEMVNCIFTQTVTKTHFHSKQGFRSIQIDNIYQYNRSRSLTTNRWSLIFKHPNLCPNVKQKSEKTCYIPLSGNKSAVLWGMDVLPTVPVCVVQSLYNQRRHLRWLRVSWALLLQTDLLCVYAVLTAPVHQQLTSVMIQSVCVCFGQSQQTLCLQR